MASVFAELAVSISLIKILLTECAINFPAQWKPEYSLHFCHTSFYSLKTNGLWTFYYGCSQICTNGKNKQNSQSVQRLGRKLLV